MMGLQAMCTNYQMLFVLLPPGSVSLALLFETEGKNIAMGQRESDVARA